MNTQNIWADPDILSNMADIQLDAAKIVIKNAEMLQKVRFTVLGL